MNIDPSLLQPTSILGYLLVFLGGIVTSIGPCNVAMIPLIISYIGGSRDLPQKRTFAISLVFTIGLSITFMLLGVIAAFVGSMFGGSSRWWYYLVGIVCILIGLQIFGVFHLEVPQWMNALREKVKTKGLLGALMLGLVSGLVSSQCATPVLAAILTYVMAQKSGMLYGAALLFIYALGRGVPIIIAGTFTGVVKRLLQWGSWSVWIERASGLIIILVGFYFIWIA